MSDEEKAIAAKSIAKDGVWQVPPEERPANWQTMGLKEPDSTVVATTQPEPISTALVVKRDTSAAPKQETATNMGDVPHMQASLVEWCRSKLADVRAEAEELAASYKLAIERKWKASTLKKHSGMALKRITFYEKMLAALEAGYCLFPTVDCELFAIRTDRTTPKYQARWLTWGAPNFVAEAAPDLPVGQGEYHSPNPVVWSRAQTRNVRDNAGELQKTEGTFFNTGPFREVDFPLVMAKPQVMDAAGKAMALKVFDEVGIISDYQRRTEATGGVRAGGDPIIVGHIIDPKPRGYAGRERKVRTFLIAWHVDTKDL
jgi:hypothetical protein